MISWDRRESIKIQMFSFTFRPVCFIDSFIYKFWTQLNSDYCPVNSTTCLPASRWHGIRTLVTFQDRWSPWETCSPFAGVLPNTAGSVFVITGRYSPFESYLQQFHICPLYKRQKLEETYFIQIRVVSTSGSHSARLGPRVKKTLFVVTFSVNSFLVLNTAVSYSGGRGC
jgi:hypothetical protein